MNIKELNKNLQKGEYFKDGDRIFIIDEVMQPGIYESHEVTLDEVANADESNDDNETGDIDNEPGDEKIEKTEETNEKAMERKKLEKLNRAELIELLEKEGKTGEGLKKNELIELLLQ